MDCRMRQLCNHARTKRGFNVRPHNVTFRVNRAGRYSCMLPRGRCFVRTDYFALGL